MANGSSYSSWRKPHPADSASSSLTETLSKYDVVIDSASRFLRVQVKGFSCRKGCGGYVRRLSRGNSGMHYYRSEDLDFFAVYIIPAQAWYLIPSARVLLPTPKMWFRVYPDGAPRRGRHTHEHDYEPYREAWELLTKSRAELMETHNLAKRRKNAARSSSAQ